MWLSITQKSRRHPNAFISKHSFSVSRVLLKRKGIKDRSRPGISKDNNRFSQYPCLFLHTALLFSFKVNYVYLFSLNYKNKQWPSSENFFISNFLYTSCYCSLPFWGLGDDYGQFSYLTPPHFFGEWLWKPARLHCYPSVNYKCARHPKHWGGSAVIRKNPRGYGQCHLRLARWPLEHQMCKRGMINCFLDESCKWAEATKTEEIRASKFPKNSSFCSWKNCLLIQRELILDNG